MTLCILFSVLSNFAFIYVLKNIFLTLNIIFNVRNHRTKSPISVQNHQSETVEVRNQRTLFPIHRLGHGERVWRHL